MNQPDTNNEVARLREELQRLRVDFTNLRESYSIAMMKEVRYLQKLEKAEAELLQSQDINSFLDTEFRIACKRAEKAEEKCAKWRKVAEALAHKQNVKLDQRKFGKKDWWNKQLENDQ